MKNKIVIVLLLSVLGCSSDPYPIYVEGEVLWRLSDIPYSLSDIEVEPLITPDGQELIYRNVYTEQTSQFKLMKRSLFINQQSIIYPFGYAADISPDGQWLAFNSSYGAISKIKLNGDSLQMLTANDDFSPTWHPNNKSIVYYHSSNDVNDPGGMFSLGWDGSKELVAVSAGHPDFFPDGRRIICTRGFDQSIWKKFPIFDIVTKKEVARLDASVNEDNRYPKISPDGVKIVYWNTNGIHIMNTDGTGVNRLLPYRHFYEHKQGDYLGFFASSPSWHPDAKHIVYQHYAITEHWTCPSGFNCTDAETFKGVVSIRKLRVRD